MLVRDEERTRALRAALRGIQAIEDALPYPRRTARCARTCRSASTTWSPTSGRRAARTPRPSCRTRAALTRKYGRTILLRYNVMTHPDLFAISQAMWTAAMAPEHASDLGEEGGFYRTLWHEIGHYLGVDRDRQGRDLGQALQENAGPARGDEVRPGLALRGARRCRRAATSTTRALRDVYAAGILRMLQKSKPRRGQPYQTMQLMQMNYFLERGLLASTTRPDGCASATSAIPKSVAALLERCWRCRQRATRPRRTPSSSSTTPGRRSCTSASPPGHARRPSATATGS